MDATPENAIRPLLSGRGKLLESFEGFSDTQLRHALGQLIDGLERMDDLATGVEFISGDWRKGLASKSDWKSYADWALKPTPLMDRGAEPWEGAQWCDLEGRDKLVSNLDRAELEAGIKDAWEFTRRFNKMFAFAIRESRRLMEGEYLQSEDDKPQIPLVKPKKSLRP